MDGVNTGPPGLDWQRDDLSANGLSLHVESVGGATAEPLLLVMGLGCQLIQWPEALCADLVTRGFRVIRFDNRDIGLSADANRGARFNLRADFLRTRMGLAAGPANYRLYDMAQDTVALMDALGLTRAHLVGVSMGGMISQLAAAMFAPRVSSLTSIMSGTNHRWTRQSRLDLLLRMATPPPDHRRETIVARSSQTMQLIGSPRYPTPIDDLRAFAGRAFDRAFRPGGVLRQMHAIIATPCFEDRLAQIIAPTQVIHGSADPLLYPACGRRSAVCIRGARLEMIDGMGHDLPEALLPRIAELIGANAGRG